MRVYVMGSVSSCTDRIENVADRFEGMGFEVRFVKKEDDLLSNLIRKCYANIEWADLVVAVPKVGYPAFTIGDGVLYEIEYARALGKPVMLSVYS